MKIHFGEAAVSVEIVSETLVLYGVQLPTQGTALEGETVFLRDSYRRTLPPALML